MQLLSIRSLKCKAFCSFLILSPSQYARLTVTGKHKIDWKRNFVFNKNEKFWTSYDDNKVLKQQAFQKANYYDR